MAAVSAVALIYARIVFPSVNVVGDVVNVPPVDTVAPDIIVGFTEKIVTPFFNISNVIVPLAAVVNENTGNFELLNLNAIGALNVIVADVVNTVVSSDNAPPITGKKLLFIINIEFNNDNVFAAEPILVIFGCVAVDNVPATFVADIVVAESVLVATL